MGDIPKEVKKTYYFKNNSWWDSNGCSCCESELMECYNCEDIPHSVHSEEDCYIEAYAHFMKLDDITRSLLNFVPLSEIQWACEEVGIVVEVE